jgi:hypothetical protein
MNRRPLNGQIEFLVLTRWRSIDAFEAFAGGDIGGAVVEPGALAALVEFDLRRAMHGLSPARPGSKLRNSPFLPPDAAMVE